MENNEYKMKLRRSFYLRPTLKVAEDLIGKFLIHKKGGKIYEGMIVETEAYAGFNDLASHGSKGKTKRNAIMFEKGGFAYVYLIYGIYHCLNFSTEKKDYPSAVLIRALNLPGTDGPGKLCRKFQIKKETHNGLDLTGNTLWVEDRGIKLKPKTGPRIGVDYALHCARWPLRFYLEKM